MATLKTCNNKCIYKKNGITIYDDKSSKFRLVTFCENGRKKLEEIKKIENQTLKPISLSNSEIDELILEIDSTNIIDCKYYDGC